MIHTASPVQPLAERRANRRYPVSVALEYRIVLADRTVTFGVGTVVNMSSRGVLFQTADVLPCSGPIELWIAWPTKLDDTIALELYVGGKTVRIDGAGTAVRISKTEFRIRGKRSMKGMKGPV